MTFTKIIRHPSVIIGILVLIVAIGTFLLTLRQLPPGITNDETDIGYEAYSIAQTGKDQWRNFLPIQYFSGFGGTRLPLLIYWTVPFVKVMGLSQESVRLAGVSAGLFAVTGFFILLLKLYHKPIFAGLTTVIFIINPWFWGLSRTTNEAVIALALTMWAIWLLFKSKEKKRYLLFAIALFGLSAYAYYSSQIFVPFLVPALFLGLPWLRRINLRIKLISTVVLIIIISPLIFKTISGNGSATRLNQTGLLSNVSLVGLVNDKRGVCEQQAFAIWCRGLYNKPSMWASEILSNYLNHFSLSFLFVDNWFVGILPSGRLFYLGLLPGLLFGIYFVLKKDDTNHKFLWISWLLIAPIADSVTSNGHAMRAMLMVPPLIVISSLGWRDLIFRETFHKKLKIFLIATVGFVLVFEVAHFMTDYIIYFPKRNSMYTHYQYQPLFEKLLAIEKKHPKIYISNASGSIKQYAFYVFYSQYDPKKFQNGFEMDWKKEAGSWIWVSRIGKWNFVKSLPNMRTVPENSLFVASPEEIQQGSGPKLVNVIGNSILLLDNPQPIKYLSGDVAFVISAVKKFPVNAVCNQNSTPETIEAICRPLKIIQ